MDQPVDLATDEIPQKQRRRSGCAVAFAVMAVFLLGLCCVIPSMLYDSVFKQSVLLERQGWRFEGRYAVFFGVVTESSKLSYQDKEVGQSLPRPVYLMTPMGEFVAGDPEWNAVWSDPPIWDKSYRLPERSDDEPWVTQIEKTAEFDEFLAKGFYQAPPEVHSFGVPWTNQQFRGTPTHWVYVYRLSWPDTKFQGYESHAVRGYWVDPQQMDDLDWD